jgi:hypothetical protein
MLASFSRLMNSSPRRCVHRVSLGDATAVAPRRNHKNELHTIASRLNLNPLRRTMETSLIVSSETTVDELTICRCLR